jgi:hypothetical protein
MIEKESSAALKKFLESTHLDLDRHYKQVDALLDRRYFSH